MASQGSAPHNPAKALADWWVTRGNAVDQWIKLSESFHDGLARPHPSASEHERFVHIRHVGRVYINPDSHLHIAQTEVKAEVGEAIKAQRHLDGGRIEDEEEGTEVLKRVSRMRLDLGDCEILGFLTFEESQGRRVFLNLSLGAFSHEGKMRMLLCEAHRMRNRCIDPLRGSAPLGAQNG